MKKVLTITQAKKAVKILRKYHSKGRFTDRRKNHRKIKWWGICGVATAARELKEAGIVFERVNRSMIGTTFFPFEIPPHIVIRAPLDFSLRDVK